MHLIRTFLLRRPCVFRYNIEIPHFVSVEGNVICANARHVTTRNVPLNSFEISANSFVLFKYYVTHVHKHLPYPCLDNTFKGVEC